MEYVSIFDSVPWKGVGISVLQTFILYWLLLFGLKAVGRRVFGEMGPQDLIILLIIAEACNTGLSSQEAGFWGTIASVLTILSIGGLVERMPFLRKLLESGAIKLCEDGVLDRNAMHKNLVDEEDLVKLAHEYGREDYKSFACVLLEGDGSLTGILADSAQKPGLKKETKPIG